MQKALEEKDSQLLSIKTALKQSQLNPPSSIPDKTEVRKLRAELDEARVELAVAKRQKAEATTKQVEAEVKESSACKAQSNLAKSLSEANSKIEEGQKQLDQESRKRIEAEQRAIRAENAVSTISKFCGSALRRYRPVSVLAYLQDHNPATSSIKSKSRL